LLYQATFYCWLLLQVSCSNKEKSPNFFKNMHRKKNMKYQQKIGPEIFHFSMEKKITRAAFAENG